MQRLLLALLATILAAALGGVSWTNAAHGNPHVASGWTLVKYPQVQPACTGVGWQGPVHFDRLDCGFGWVGISGTTSTTTGVEIQFVAPNGDVLQTQKQPEVRWRAANSAWQFSIVPGASWPAGPITIRARLGGVTVGETTIFVNLLGADVEVPDGKKPGEPIPVSGFLYEIDTVPPSTINKTDVAGTFKLRVVWPDGTVKGPYGPFTANASDGDPLTSDAGRISETLPAEATDGLTAGPETNFQAAISVEVVDAAYTDPVTGEWKAARAGAGSAGMDFGSTSASVVLDNSFVSSVGWVKPGDTYPSRIFVRNHTDQAISGAVVNVPSVDGMTYTAATPATAGDGSANVAAGTVTWNVGAVGPGELKTLVLEAKADTLGQDPQIVWKNLSTTATLTYTGGAPITSASKGPKVVPPSAKYDSARYGYRPFPVVPVDYYDRKHEASHTGDKLSKVINSPSIPGSTFNLFQEMSFGQLFPNGTVPSAGMASADWSYGPGFDFSSLSPAGTCTGTTFKDVKGTALYPERIKDGWYQLPGDTGYYGQDKYGSAVPGAVVPGGALLMDIDSACGPTGKLVYDAAAIADPEIDYSDYDTNKDGVVDFFMAVFTGLGGNGASQLHVPPYDNVWPHSSSLEFYFTDQATGLKGYISDDQLKNLRGQPLWYTDTSRSAMTTQNTGDALKVYVRVGPYNVNPESAIDKASVISHEYGHSLGLPDYYSLGSRETYGTWNLMASDHSQHMDVNAKRELGWVVPRVLEPGQSVTKTAWKDSKIDTHSIQWKQPDGTAYELTGPNVHNGETYIAQLPSRQIIAPSTVANGASPDHVWWSGSGNDFGCAPLKGRNLDIYVPELASLPAGTPVKIEFKSYWQIEWDYDYGFVMVSEDGGTTYRSLPSAKGYTTDKAFNPNANGCQSQYGNGVTGSSGSYEAGTATADRALGNYPDNNKFLADEYTFTSSGKEAVVRFSYATDPGLAKRAWFIDDVKITAGSTVVYQSNMEDSDDPRVFNGGCAAHGRVAASCTLGWKHVSASAGSPADHAYLMEMRDRSSFDLDGKGQSDRGAPTFAPGLLLVYTDEAHGYGNVGTDSPPAQTPLDSQPQPGNEAPNLDDAAFTNAAGDDKYSDLGAGWTDNYTAPGGNWTLKFGCLSFDVLAMSGEDIAPAMNLQGDVAFSLGSGCGVFDYGYGVPNQGPTAVAQARPTTVYAGDAVTLDGSLSYDDQTAASALGYAWDLDGNGTYDASGQTVQYAYAAAGTYTATLKVTDPAGLSDTDSVTITVRPPEADLAVTQTDSPDPAKIGANLTYTIRVVNNGPSPAGAVTLTDKLPKNAGYGSASATQGTCAKPQKGAVTCSLGTLARGQTVTVTIVVKPSAKGTITNTATASSTTTDPVSSNNTSTASTTVNA